MACQLTERNRQKIKMMIIIIITAAMFFAEIAIGFRTDSLALVNDSFNVVSDLISLIIGFICLMLVKRENKKNTYGWARVEIWAALVNSVFMLALCFSIFTSAVERLIQPVAVKEADLVLIVGGVGLAVNLIGLVVFLDETLRDIKKEKKEKKGAANRQGGCSAGDGCGGVNEAFDGVEVGVTKMEVVAANERKRKLSVVSIDFPHQCIADGDGNNAVGGDGNDNVGGDGNDADGGDGNDNVGGDGNDADGGDGNDNVGDGDGNDAVGGNGDSGKNFVFEEGKIGATNMDDGSKCEEKTSSSLTVHRTDDIVGEVDQVNIHNNIEILPAQPSFENTSIANARNVCLDMSEVGVCQECSDDDDDDDDEMENMATTISHIYAGPPVEEEIPRRKDKKKKKKKIKSGNQMNIQGIFLHLLGDALGSVSVIVSGVVNKYCQGDWVERIDPTISLIVVIIIIITTVPLLKQSSNILLQRVPRNVNIPLLMEELKKEVKDISNIHDLHVWQLVGTRIIASLHIRCIDLPQYIRTSKQIKRFFHDNGIHSTTIQPEFIEHQEFTSDRECFLECGPDLKCHEDTCCSERKSKKKKISTTSNASGVSCISTDTAISMDSDFGGNSSFI